MPNPELPRDFSDRVMRDALEDIDNLRAVLARMLGDKAKRFDVSKRRILPRDFLLPNWSGRERDFLCEIPYLMDGVESWALVCVLVEHQTRPDRLMPIRTLIYAVLYWEQRLRAWEKSGTDPFRLPPIVPIILHASPTGWTGPRTLKELLDDPSEFHHFAPTWNPLFWEIGKEDADQLLANEDAFMQLMAIVRAEDDEQEEAMRVYREFFAKVSSLRTTNIARWTHLARFALGWVLHRRPKNERGDWMRETEESHENLAAREEIRHMKETIAKSFVDEGIVEGEAKALRSTIMRRGSRRFGLPAEEQSAILNSISDTNRLDSLVDAVDIAVSWDDLFRSVP